MVAGLVRVEAIAKVSRIVNLMTGTEAVANKVFSLLMSMKALTGGPTTAATGSGHTSDMEAAVDTQQSRGACPMYH